MNLSNFTELNTQELRQIEGGGIIGPIVRAAKRAYKVAKTHIDDFIDGWNEG